MNHMRQRRMVKWCDNVEVGIIGTVSIGVIVIDDTNDVRVLL